MPEQEPSHLTSLIEVGAYWKHKVTLTAVKLDLFTFLSNGSRGAAEVAGHFGGKADAFCVFLNALTALGLLAKEGDGYANSSFADQFLVRGREHYKGDQLIVDDAYWGLWGRLEETLMTGASPLDGSLFHNDADLAERLIVGLHRDALSIAERLVKRVGLKGARSLLDLGGGAGTYALAFCRRYPDLKATVFDLPNATRVTRSVVKEQGMQGRVKVVDGDFLKDPIGGGYDVVLMSNILHGLGPQQSRGLFQRVYEALDPGGSLIVRDVVMSEGLDSPAWGAVFSVNMLLHTGRGRCYSFGEIAAWLEGAGFAGAREVERGEVVTAKKPT